MGTPHTHGQARGGTAGLGSARVARETHSGACLCGGVRYEVTGPLRGVVVCHCSRCRRTHGHTGAYSTCSASDLVLVADGTLRWYEADERARGFCTNCGASIFWRAAEGETISIAAGTLLAPTGLRTVAQIYTGSRGDYYELLGEGHHYSAGLPKRD
jgi:hypothetical protein